MIIFLSGSINAGKSTVARLLAKKLSKPAIVEIDALRKMIAWMPIEQAIPINLENAVSIIKNLAKKGFTVIIPYPLSEKNWKYISKALKGTKETVFVFTLSPKMEIALKNRGKRKLTGKEKIRIKHHYKIGISAPKFGIVIDNSYQTPKETAKRILEKLNTRFSNPSQKKFPSDHPLATRFQ